ncbi:MAG: zinc-ribbon and DUF3426 domain-containing protein [Marinomonas foliarum]|uniref:Zinc-ribbon and DUF3426 domain-containing protein n=1 Tax=Marinomonas foliarum TaxID=491950 RepID=A0ABX7IP72_9GAMM|nr:zinc-ribbon and DUF3426 domain-containing protein [Marinomonas foliarum]QRV23523.1 zinc-ribbon and DUF3426 domain-containing protein [Marinomonas foliarum]
MANSFITRCPKCSTAFRVSDEVLSMAKGKVRCGQCFHIFDAGNILKQPERTQKREVSQENKAPIKETALAENLAQSDLSPPPLAPRDQSNTNPNQEQFTPADEIVNPDWLHTLFDDEDLYPLGHKKEPSQKEKESESNSTSKKTAAEANTTKEAPPKADDPAPWEVELAEVEAALKSTSHTVDTKKPTPKSTTTSAKAETAEPHIEPDYMVALHSLAQSAAEQTRPSDIKNKHSILEQLSAQQSLAPLLGESEETSRKKKSHPWLWFFATLFGAALLTAQIAMHFFDEGSRSSNFRSLYRTLCSYSGCVLPGFEDISAITIQHVRIQSHPTIPNTLLVNAIITNTSDFSQPMPKIALEFFDLNGQPVAARLFAPSDYLHKDFLDITYMPPNTPIHLVIPIQDPGARAVTHQLRSFSADTRSY